MGTREGHGRASSEDGDGPSARMTTFARACFAPWPLPRIFLPSALCHAGTFDNRQRLKVHMSEHDGELSLPKIGQARRQGLRPHRRPSSMAPHRPRGERDGRDGRDGGGERPSSSAALLALLPLHSTPPCVARCPAARRRAGRASTASSRPTRNGAAARSAARRSAPVRRKKAGTLARFAGRRRTR